MSIFMFLSAIIPVNYVDGGVTAIKKYKKLSGN